MYLRWEGRLNTRLDFGDIFPPSLHLGGNQIRISYSDYAHTGPEINLFNRFGEFVTAVARLPGSARVVLTTFCKH